MFRFARSVILVALLFNLFLGCISMTRGPTPASEQTVSERPPPVLPSNPDRAPEVLSPPAIPVPYDPYPVVPTANLDSSPLTSVTPMTRGQVEVLVRDGQTVVVQLPDQYVTMPGTSNVIPTPPPTTTPATDSGSGRPPAPAKQPPKVSAATRWQKKCKVSDDQAAAILTGTQRCECERYCKKEVNASLTWCPVFIGKGFCQ